MSIKATSEVVLMDFTLEAVVESKGMLIAVSGDDAAVTEELKLAFVKRMAEFGITAEITSVTMTKMTEEEYYEKTLADMPEARKAEFRAIIAQIKASEASKLH